MYNYTKHIFTANITNKQIQKIYLSHDVVSGSDITPTQRNQIDKLENLTVLKRSPDLLNSVKIGQDQLQLKMKHILFYGGCCHFGQVT